MRVKDLVHSGRDFKREDFVFFLGRGSEEGCLSQWSHHAFEIDGIVYRTAEHWMMAEKARLFGDEESIHKVIKAKRPEVAKRIGRRVQGWDQELWDANKYRIVVEGNLAKFSQNPGIRDYLLSTGDKIIVEAADYDPVWGVGMSVREKDIVNPKDWKGENLLGFALMEVRDILRQDY